MMKKTIIGLLLLILQQSIFAQVKITDMPTVSGKPVGAWIPVVILGANKKVKADSIAAMAITDSALISKIIHDSLTLPENGLYKEADKIKLGGALTITHTRIYDSTGSKDFVITNKGGYSTDVHKDFGGYMSIGPYSGLYGSSFANQYIAENFLGLRTMPLFKSLDIGLNGSGIGIDSFSRIKFHAYINNAAKDSILTTDASGNVLLKAPTGIIAGANFHITDSIVGVGDTAKVFSADGGGGLTYPNLTAKYLNSYGNFVGLNTDSIAQGSTNLFSQWVDYSGLLFYPNNGSVGGYFDVGSAGGYKIGNNYMFRSNPTNEAYYLANSGDITSSGLNVISIGSGAMSNSTSGDDNIAIGKDALKNTAFAAPGIEGNRNIAIGLQSLKAGIGANNNIAIGTDALSNILYSGFNVVIGDGAAYSTTNLTDAIVIGSGAFSAGTSDRVFAIGKDALKNNTGNGNFAIGYNSLILNTSGISNTAVGESSLISNIIGARNTAVGSSSGGGSIGNDNTYLGYQTQGNGNSNTYIGANIALLSVSNNIAISSGDGVIKIHTTSDGVTSLFKGADVASASTITATGNSFHVTGTTNITSISGTVLTAGAIITIIFDGVLTFTDGSNLKLNGNFTTTADDTITLLFDGTNFYEKGRSIN